MIVVMVAGAKDVVVMVVIVMVVVVLEVAVDADW